MADPPTSPRRLGRVAARIASWSAAQRAAAAIGPALLVLVFAGLVYAGLGREADSRYWMAHANAVIDGVERVVQRMTDAETGQRGYLLTHRERYLAPFHAAERDVREQLDSLVPYTRVHAGQSARLDSLTALAGAKFAELDSTVALETAGDHAGAIAILETDRGRQLMDDARAVATQMEQRERDVLTASTAHAVHVAAVTRWVLIVGALLAVAIALGINALLDAQRQRLGAQAAELGAQAREFTAVNAALEAAVEELRVGQERLRLALAAGRLGPWEWDIVTGAVTWSAAVEGMHGVAAGTFPGTFEAFERDIHPDDREAVHSSIGVALERHTPYNVRYRIVRPDGGTRWLEAHGTVVLDTAGHPARLVGVCSDITERQQTEDRLRFIAQASGVLASSLDVETTLANVAHLAVPMLADWCTVDLLPPGGDALERFTIAHQDPTRVALVRDLEARYPDAAVLPIDASAVLRSGTTQLVPDITDAQLVARARDPEHLRTLRALGLRSCMAVPLRARGTVFGVIGFLTAESGRSYTAVDATLAEDLARRGALAIDNARLFVEMTEARHAAEAANAAKSEFLATMSHELRTPLNAISGYVDLLAMELRGPVTDAQREDLARIKKSGQHLLSLINDILNLARIEAGRLELNVSEVPLIQVLENVETLMAPLMQAKGLAYTDVRGQPGLTVRADGEKLQQILLNLLTNACKFTPSGGRVEVDCAVTGPPARGDGALGAVVVRVRDTGRGIPPGKLASIFEPFVQIDRQSTHESQQGVGLGLAISRHLARAMGGELTAESAVGRGSTFTLTLPPGGCGAAAVPAMPNDAAADCAPSGDAASLE